MTIIQFKDKKLCPCTMETEVAGSYVRMKCILPWAHTGQHLSPWGRWFNRLEARDTVSKWMDNSNAKSMTGKRKIIVLPADMGRSKK